MLKFLINYLLFLKMSKNIDIEDNFIKYNNSEYEDLEFMEQKGKGIIKNPFNEKCSVCKSLITNIKYICVICPDCFLCSKCEENHIHPVLKCKSSQLSTLKDIYIYMNKRNLVIHSFLKNEKDSSVFGLFQDMFSGKYEIKLSSVCDKFTMRPNKSLKLPITLQNLSTNAIECKPLQLYLFGKNTKDLKVYTKELDLVINKREQNDVFIQIESNNYCTEYNFTIELYSNKNIKLKTNSLEFSITVNEDEKEEELNEHFKDYPNIILTSKETKIGIKKILENEWIKEDPITILQFLKNNNNDIDKTINNFSALNQKKKSFL
jgi:hypothetical protein